MVKLIAFWLNAARAYSLPITVLSWLVAFIYSIQESGNYILGIIALFGICFVHLATNLIDDYLDYKIISSQKEFLESAQDCKCAYLRNNSATLKDLKNAIIFFLLIAGIIGAILLFFSGKGVILLSIIALLIALFYQRLSLVGLGEVAIIIAYGPLMFEGVYYVMCSKFSSDILILSIACTMVTNTVLYVHMLMDFDGDKCSHKKTLCLLLKNKENALAFLKFFYIVGYFLLGFLALKNKNYFLFLPYLTIFQVFELNKHLKNYNIDKTNLPTIKFWHKPLDNWDKIKTTSSAPFYFRFFYTRNILVTYMLLISIAIIMK